MIGSVLDKYEILQKIGEGGMASVYRGRHVTLGRDVAIKILHPHLSSAERNRQRFAREARAIENLDHDNILRIFDYSGSKAEDCYIVTEFVDGQTLQELLSEHGALPSEVVAQIGTRLADALEYAHDLGIIHRDLKPENVMVRRDGTVKLMDFGIARFLDEMHLTVTGALVGSPAYMSPEQAMEKVLDKRSDLFSLGTLLFHLVTGQLPFSGNNPSIVLRNIIEGHRPGVGDLAPEVSGPLADLVHALLQTDPDDRPQSAAEVRDRLGGVLAEVDLSADDPQWNLQAWLVDPAGYRERLDARLKVVLLEKGRARLEARDHLGALQLFNRLLSIDEDNEEVLTLVQGMHATHDEPQRPAITWAAGLGLLVGAALLTWLLWPSPPVEPAEPARGGTPAAVAPAPAPTPAPGVEPAPETTEPPVDDDGPPVAPEITPPAAAREAPAEAADGSDQRSSRPLVRVPVGEPAVLARPSPTQRLQEDGGATAPPDEGRTGSGDEPGFVTVDVPGSWGHIYVDGEHRGRTGVNREPIEVTPGTHSLVVKQDLSVPHEERFTVAPGETRHFTVPLQRKPVTIELDAALGDDCTLAVDGELRGTLGDLGHRYTLPAPDRRYRVALDCDGERQSFELGDLIAGETVRLP